MSGAQAWNGRLWFTNVFGRLTHCHGVALGVSYLKSQSSFGLSEPPPAAVAAPRCPLDAVFRSALACECDAGGPRAGSA